MNIYYTDRLYTIKHKSTEEKYFLIVERDDDEEDPRNWDTAGTLVTWDKYSIGDAHDYTEPGDFLVAQAQVLLKTHPDLVFDYFYNKEEKEPGLHIVAPTVKWEYYDDEIDRPKNRVYEIYYKGTPWGGQSKTKTYIGSITDKELFLCKKETKETFPSMDYLLETETSEQDLKMLFYLNPDIEIRNIFIYEHSGISISCARVDSFDSRCVGWFVMSKQDTQSVYAFPENVSEEIWRKAAGDYMDNLITEYDLLYSGEVYAISIEPVSKFKDFMTTCPKCIWDYRTLSRVIGEDTEWIGGLFGDKSVDMYLSDEGFDIDSLTSFNFKKDYSLETC